MNQRSLKTVKQFAAENPAFPIGGIRWNIFNEHRNGLFQAKCILRIGRKIVIDEEKYYDWIDSLNQA